MVDSRVGSRVGVASIGVWGGRDGQGSGQVQRGRKGVVKEY